MRALWLLALLGGAQAAEIVKPQWDARGRFTLQRELAAGQVLEVCEAMKPGERVRWSYRAHAKLAFNVHHHEGKAVVYSLKMSGRQGRGDFSPRSEQDFCWMWQAAKEAALPVQLTAEFQRP